tara:strand:+ start:503 stop:724 length:222 start_codon:yes stop_codon:yes gene_type:complete
MKQKNLYERLKPEYKASIDKEYGKNNRKFQHEALIRALSSEYYFTEVRYGDAFDVMNSCDIDFLGDAFNKQEL